ncbi:type II toxin-antitoxin system VapC family toxin [Patescibacteria group bacterium]|nr:type II toxin-antitoxin system VapC family toxin [Patescibacteria group bacterium]MBU4481703.1 type II toxin-antitoxin system VapC family toxin [Patescibacteria group bacterium]
MEIVVDSHTLFWFLTNNPKLSAKAKRLIETSEKVIIPSIVLMEILYLLEKNNLSYQFVEFLSELKIRNYLVYPLDLKVIAQTLGISSGLEMHDRLIIATAQIFNSPLISKDTQIKNYYLRTIW